MNKPGPAATPAPQAPTLKQQKADFTAEGSPPPGHVANARPGGAAVPAPAGTPPAATAKTPPPRRQRS